MRIVKFVLLAWVLCVSAGLAVVWDHENRPGNDQSSPSYWPAESRIQRSADLPTLVMSLHPQCSCSKSSLDELAIVLAKTNRPLESKLLFVAPKEESESWVKDELWKKAESLRNVELVQDSDGYESKLFQAATSGHVALYDSNGNLEFSGGITPSRAHSGDNVGRQALIEAINLGKANRTTSSVFGCSIFGDRR